MPVLAVLERQHAPCADIDEARFQRSAEQLGRRIARAQEHLPGPVTDLIYHPLVRRVGVRRRRGIAEQGGRYQWIVDVPDQSHQDHAALLQLVVRFLVDQVLQHKPAAKDSREPQYREADEQAARQPLRHRARPPEDHRPVSGAACPTAPHW
jgi:hypothetical protein